MPEQPTGAASVQPSTTGSLLDDNNPGWDQAHLRPPAPEQASHNQALPPETASNSPGQMSGRDLSLGLGLGMIGIPIVVGVVLVAVVLLGIMAFQELDTSSVLVVPVLSTEIPTSGNNSEPGKDVEVLPDAEFSARNNTLQIAGNMSYADCVRDDNTCADTGTTFAILDLKITNLSSRLLKVGPSYINVVTVSGETVGSHVYSQWVERSLEYLNIEPGTFAAGQVVYEIKPTDKPARLIWRDQAGNSLQVPRRK